MNVTMPKATFTKDSGSGGVTAAAGAVPATALPSIVDAEEDRKDLKHDLPNS